jgi:predicted CopG family antitoxin
MSFFLNVFRSIVRLKSTSVTSFSDVLIRHKGKGKIYKRVVHAMDERKEENHYLLITEVKYDIRDIKNAFLYKTA